MSEDSRRAHWDQVYNSKKENEVSWFQENPTQSLALTSLAGVTAVSAIIDIGGGTSRVVDNLIAKGFERVTVLDLSAAAIDSAKKRLGPNAGLVQWVTADDAMGAVRKLRPLARSCSIPFPD